LGRKATIPAPPRGNACKIKIPERWAESTLSPPTFFFFPRPAIFFIFSFVSVFVFFSRSHRRAKAIVSISSFVPPFFLPPPPPRCPLVNGLSLCFAKTAPRAGAGRAISVYGWGAQSETLRNWPPRNLICVSEGSVGGTNLPWAGVEGPVPPFFGAAVQWGAPVFFFPPFFFFLSFFFSPTWNYAAPKLGPAQAARYMLPAPVTAARAETLIPPPREAKKKIGRESPEVGGGG